MPPELSLNVMHGQGVSGIKGQGSRMAKIGPVSEINEIWTQDRRRSPEIENAFLKRDVIIKHF